MALSYPPTAPQRGDRTTFAGRVDAFITWLIGFVTELIAVVANLNSIAAGGAYSIQYTHRTSSSFVGSTTGGILAIKAASIQLDTKSLGGASVAALLSATGESTSTLKGYIRIQKVSDTSKWAVYTVTSYVQGGSGLYGDIFGTLVNSSTGGNPFADGDSVMLFFDRTGDKGDQGIPGVGFQNLTVISSTGTWTPPAGVTKAEITVIDGGQSGAVSSSSVSNGGAGGDASISVITVSSSVTYTATIGAGGTPGAAGTITAPQAGGASSFSGTGITTLTSANGTLKVPGGSGGVAYTNPGPGGDSFYAPGVVGKAPTGYGGGGPGVGTGNTGYSGKAGAVIIRY